MAFHHPLHEQERRSLMAGLGGEGLQDFGLLVHRPPKAMDLAVIFT